MTIETISQKSDRFPTAKTPQPAVETSKGDKMFFIFYKRDGNPQDITVDLIYDNTEKVEVTIIDTITDTITDEPDLEHIGILEVAPEASFGRLLEALHGTMDDDAQHTLRKIFLAAFEAGQKNPPGNFDGRTIPIDH